MEAHDQTAETIHQFIADYCKQNFNESPVTTKEDQVWQRMVKAGSTLWLDTGDIDAAAALWNTSFSALTTNNTLLNSEVQKGVYDRLIADTAIMVKKCDPGIDRKRLVQEIAFVLNAVHGLRLADRFNCDVSVELHTDFAHDVAGSLNCALRFHAIDPKRFIVKLPLTPAGLIAVRFLSDRGIRVNFTLGFSARQNYVAARFSRPAYVNVFMGRLNAFVADNKLGDGKNIGEKATLSTLAALRSLREKGLSPTRLIGASIRNGDQIAAVAGTDVLTMPPKAAQQFHDANPATVIAATTADLPIDLTPGITLKDFNGSTMWEVPEGFAVCAKALASKDPKGLTPDLLQNHFEQAGFGDLLPRWTPEALATISHDGKIPVFSTWKEKLASGSIGLDALMNISALRSFTTDQKALDERIEKHIG